MDAADPTEPGQEAAPRADEPAFDSIAGRYDLLNRLLSLGIDQAWRRQAVKAAMPRKGDVVLDLCAGTGDLTLEIWRTGLPARVIGLDRSPAMLARARRKSAGEGPEYVIGDALALPFADGEFDLVTIGFGLRNLPDRRAAVSEISRVLRPGGRLVVLEFSPPGPDFWAGVARWWLTSVVPRVGALMARHPESYRYLQQSVIGFPPPDAVAAEIESAGMSDVRWRLLWPGPVALHVATKPGRKDPAVRPRER